MQPIIMKEKEFINLFKISIFLKGINAVAELLGGLTVFFVSKAFLVTFILNLFQNELSDDPRDFMALFIVNSAASLSVSSQYFFGIYLILHGLVKIFLIINLFGKKLWAYPATIIVFSIFIIYQIYEFYLTHSIWIIGFTLFDILIVLLAGHEYGVLRKRLKNKIA